MPWYEDPVKVVVYGAGGVGGYFGARLIQSGIRVAFIARGAHLEALTRDGLRLRSPLGDAHLREITASDDPATIGPADLILLCTKTWQLDAALAAIEPLMAEGTVVVPLLNGVEAAARTAARVGAEPVLGGTCKIISRIGAPGEVLHMGATPWIAIGERAGPPSERARRIADLLEGAGIEVDVPSDIEAVVWEKLIFVASVGGVGAVTRAPVGVLRGVPETRALLEATMREIQKVAEARGVRVAGDAAAAAMRFVDTLPEAGTSSLQRDIAEGRRSELDAWTGAVVRFGSAAAVPTPVNSHLYASLLPLEQRARGELSF